MPKVTYTRVEQGFRPYTNPQPLAGLRGLGELKDLRRTRGLGSLGDANCDAGMPYDVNGNPCPGTPLQLAGAPTGSQLLYSATWQIPSSHAFSTPAQILASVLGVLKSSASIVGFQVVNASQSGGVLTLSSFGVQIQLFVNGPGFGEPNDAGSFVDHAYNQVTGLMPVVSSTVVTSLPAGVPSAPAPTGTSPFPTSADPNCAKGMPYDVNGNPCGGTFSQWLESNAWWIVAAGVAAIVLPRLL